MATTGYPQVLAVPSLYRIVRTLSVTESTTTFDISAEPVGADVVAEVQRLYPTANAALIRSRAIIKQVDVQNTGYNTDGASQTTGIAYYEWPAAGGGTPTGPIATGAQNVLWPGSAASYPSPLAHNLRQFYLQAQGAPAVAQSVNVIVWFDVPGFGT